MCTVTWIQEGDRYSLFFNRDELRTRQPALPPRDHREDEVRFLAPTDGEAGGTWIAVNEHGLSLCLLNDYSSRVSPRTGGFISRGLLVRHLVRATDLVMLKELWSEVGLQRYRPFRLLALAPGQSPNLCGWNGAEARLEEDTVTPPLCSSSFDDLGAARSRTDLLGDFSAKIDLEPRKRQLRFHQSHLPERGPYSVCMHRRDGELRPCRGRSGGRLHGLRPRGTVLYTTRTPRHARPCWGPTLTGARIPATCRLIVAPAAGG